MKRRVSSIPGRAGKRIWCTKSTWRRLRVIACLCFLYFLFAFNRFLADVKLRTTPKEDPCVVLEQSTPVRKNSRLPKVIHQLWPKEKPIPSHFKRWFSKWSELFPEVEHKLWSDEEIRALIAKDFPWFLPTFDWYPFNIMRVDAARTFILYKYGGLYVDMDYEPLVNFWDRLPDDIPSVIRSFWVNEPFQNSVMTSPPLHEFWNITWTIMLDRAKEKQAESEIFWWDTLYLTGPKVIESAVSKWEKNIHPGSRIHVLPCENWHRVSIGYQKLKVTLFRRMYDYYFKDSFNICGSVNDLRCQMGIHHSTTMWES